MDAVFFEPVNRISLDANAPRNAARCYATRSGRHYQVNGIRRDDTEDGMPSAVIPDALGIVSAGPLAVSEAGDRMIEANAAGSGTGALPRTRTSAVTTVEAKLSTVLAPCADNIQVATSRAGGGSFTEHGEFVPNGGLPCRTRPACCSRSVSLMRRGTDTDPAT